jgi:hypothetical protein
VTQLLRGKVVHVNPISSSEVSKLFANYGDFWLKAYDIIHSFSLRKGKYFLFAFISDNKTLKEQWIIFPSSLCEK